MSDKLLNFQGRTCQDFRFDFCGRKIANCLAIQGEQSYKVLKELNENPSNNIIEKIQEKSWKHVHIHNEQNIYIFK